MCIAPNTLADGTITACHKCWQCIEQAVNDWAGRNIAEKITSVQSHAVTLTYGRDDGGRVDHARSAILTYSDVQKMLKRLRKAGFPVRYFITGEFGTKNGRCHWHAVFHWLERVPDHEIARNFQFPFWDHGHTYWKQPSYEALKYNCKYILKDHADNARQTALPHMSKNPPLGDGYFRQLAERLVENGLSPQTLDYSFKGVTRRRKDGQTELVPFRMKEKTADNFCSHFVAAWELKRPDEVIPPSEVLHHWLTPELKEERGIIARHKDMPVGSARTVPYSLQLQKDADRLAKLRELRERDEAWAKPSTEAKFERPKQPWLGPRNLDEWNAEYEHWEKHGKEQQQQQQQRQVKLEQLERKIELVERESFERQGRVEIFDHNGKGKFVHKDDAVKFNQQKQRGKL